MTHSSQPVALTRKSLLPMVGGSILLLVSLSCFGGGVACLLAGNGGGGGAFFVLGLMPLVLILSMAQRAALAREAEQSSAGFLSRIDHLQKRLNEQDDLFRAITDYTPAGLTIFDNDNQYWFVNASAARMLGDSDANIVGQKPTGLLGPEKGRAVEQLLDKVRQTGQPIDILNQIKGDREQVDYVKTSYQILSPVGGFGGGIMARDEDLTSIILERERQESMQRQLISTLVAVVDRRDPYAAGHSARVGQLSRLLAVGLQLSEREIEAAEIAGSLMNFGKVLVSRSILTKAGALTPAELQSIRNGILTSADILSLIDFGSPVVPTLRQVLERVDGSGAPSGLKGEAILITARIVAVANAFVAMVSPRAYRPGIDLAQAARRIAEDAGKAFDPRVVAALETYLTKNAARLNWLSVTKAG